jgi:hypothetical protein
MCGHLTTAENHIILTDDRTIGMGMDRDTLATAFQRKNARNYSCTSLYHFNRIIT